VQNDTIRKLIKSEFELHPKAQLKDYYKLFFQGTFGPGHIISNKSSAREFLENEIKDSSIFEESDYQNISHFNEFYRVNLNVINKGIISFDNYLDAFLKSVEFKNEISQNEWLEHWGKIEKQIFMMKIPIENIEQQAAELWKIIESKQLVRHSDIYRTAYSPHYRLINAEQLHRINF